MRKTSFAFKFLSWGILFSFLPFLSSCLPSNPLEDSSCLPNNQLEDSRMHLTLTADRLVLSDDQNAFSIKEGAKEYHFLCQGLAIENQALVLRNGSISSSLPGMLQVETKLAKEGKYHFDYGFHGKKDFTSKTFSFAHTYSFNEERPSFWSLESEGEISFLSIELTFDGKEASSPYYEVPTKEITFSDIVYSPKSFVSYPSFPVTQGLHYTLSEDRTYYTVDNANYADLGEEKRIVFPSSYQGLPVRAIGHLGLWYRNDAIQEIVIPSSITKIENEAFASLALKKLYWDAESCDDFPRRNGIFYPTVGQAIDVIFGPHVRRIPSRLFLPSVTTPNIHSSLRSVSFSGGSHLEEIGEYAFFGQETLSRIDLPDGVRSIGEYAFSGAGLEEVSLPSLVSLGKGAFRWNHSLKHFLFGSSLEQIGESAFEGSDQLEEADLRQTKLVSLPFASFKRCTKLSSVLFPASLLSIGESAFEESGISALILPDTLKSIGDRSFYHLSSLTYLRLGKNLKSLGEEAFSECPFVQDLIIDSSSLEDMPLNHKTFLNLGHATKGTSVYLRDISYLPANCFYSSADEDSLPKISNLFIYSPLTIGIRAFYGIEIPNSQFYGFQDVYETMTIGEGNDTLLMTKARKE